MITEQDLNTLIEVAQTAQRRDIDAASDDSTARDWDRAEEAEDKLRELKQKLLDQSYSRFCWVVEIEVDETWVADGFDLKDEDVAELLQLRLSFATASEVGGRVLKAPDPARIRKSQGYCS